MRRRRASAFGLAVVVGIAGAVAGEIALHARGQEAGAVFGTVEAVKTVSDLYLPVAGTINELNPALANAPELVNTDPYGEGWMIKMTVTNPADVDALLDVSGYEAVVG